MKQIESNHFRRKSNQLIRISIVNWLWSVDSCFMTVRLRLLIELNVFNHFNQKFSSWCKRQMRPINSHVNVETSKSSKDMRTRYSVLIDHYNCGTLDQKGIFKIDSCLESLNKSLKLQSASKLDQVGSRRFKKLRVKTYDMVHIYTFSLVRYLQTICVNPLPGIKVLAYHFVYH